MILDFNPRSHEGSDEVQDMEKVENTISIHAPTRGATVLPVRFGCETDNFNPRSHEGSDGLTGL